MIGTVPSVALALALIACFVIGGGIGYGLRRTVEGRKNSKPSVYEVPRKEEATEPAAVPGVVASEPAEVAAAPVKTVVPAQAVIAPDRDNLRLIKGLGPRAETLLHEFGISSFDQISQWDETAIAWIEAKLGSRGRIERENWVEQARALSASK